MTNETEDIQQLALAIKSLEVAQLQRLQGDTDKQRSHFITVAAAAVNLNEVLLKKLYELENRVITSKGLADATDKVTDVRMYASANMESIKNEWNKACNSERVAADPRVVGAQSGYYVGDTTVSEYTGFNRDGNR